MLLFILFLVLIQLRFLYSSSSDLVDKEQLTEFWNRDDEVNASEEDISDSDGISACPNIHSMLNPLARCFWTKRLYNVH